MPESAPSPAATRVRVAFPAPSSAGPVEHVALVTLDRPEALNAIDFPLLGELADALEALDGDERCHAIVVTGGERAFAAGVDIRELAGQTPVSLLVEDPFRGWDRLEQIRKPIVAAVRGVALGGGCELALLCDLLVAGDDATFGQPEIRLGLIPGAGGSQRLTRAIGKARAMDLILTGRTIDAWEAERLGLVTKVVPAEATVEAALALAARVAAMPAVATLAAKDVVNRAFELPLDEGIELERRTFYLLFATEDMREGAAAFIEKRTPAWRGR